MSVSRQVDAKLRGRPASGIRKFARDHGLSEADVRRSIKVASLSPEAKQVARETGLDDNRSAMLRAADAPPDEQAGILRAIAAGTVKASTTKLCTCPNCGTTFDPRHR